MIFYPEVCTFVLLGWQVVTLWTLVCFVVWLGSGGDSGVMAPLVGNSG